MRGKSNATETTLRTWSAEKARSRCFLRGHASCRHAGGGRVGTACHSESLWMSEGRGGGYRDAGEIEHYRDNVAHLIGESKGASAGFIADADDVCPLCREGCMMQGRTSTRVSSFLPTIRP